MSDAGLGEEYERELTRVGERIRTMPLTRLASCSDQVFGLCGAFADLAHEAGSGIAGATALPRLGDHALPDQLQVLGMELAAVGDSTVITLALEQLVDMRKALP
jgi:hypothetical protein